MKQCIRKRHRRLKRAPSPVSTNTRTNTFLHNSTARLFLFLKYDNTLNVTWDCELLLWKTGIQETNIPKALSYASTGEKLRWFIWTIRHNEVFNLYRTAVGAEFIAGRLRKRRLRKSRRARDFLWMTDYRALSIRIRCTLNHSYKSGMFVPWVPNNSVCAYINMTWLWKDQTQTM